MREYLESRREAGFTLIELVVVVGIAALILVGVLVFVPTVQQSRRDNARKDALNKIASQVERYASDNSGTYPTQANVAAALNGTSYLANIRNPNTGAAITVAGGSCAAPALNTYNYQAPGAGSNPYQVCTRLESNAITTAP